MRLSTISAALESLQAIAKKYHDRPSHVDSELEGYGFVRSIQSFVLDWGSVFYSANKGDHSIFVQSTIKVSSPHNFHQVLSLEDNSEVVYSEGFRIDEKTGGMTFTSWCSPKDGQHLALDSTITENHQRYAYFGVVLKRSLVEKTFQAFPDSRKEGILPLLILNNTPLPESGFIVDEH